MRDKLKDKRNEYMVQPTNKQLLDEVFAISGIIKVEVTVISRRRRQQQQQALFA